MAESRLEEPSTRAARETPVAAGLAVVGLLLTPLVATAPTLGIVLAGAFLLVVLTVLWPAWAVICFVAINPFLAGLPRGGLVPGLRPNEVLLAPLMVGVAFALLGRWRRSSWLRRRPHELDVVVVCLAVAGSVSTLLWMYARSRQIAADDVLYALTLWKLLALYAAVRLIVRQPGAIRSALAAVLISAAVLGLVGVLQALGVGPVIELLTALIPAEDGGYSFSSARAMSFLGNPIAYGDVMIYAGVLAASLALRMPRHARLLWATAAALAVCAMASGQFSIVLGMVVAGTVFAVITRTAGRALAIGAAVLGVAALLLRPVVTARLDDADPQTGLPSSWTGRHGRLDNLETYFWPPIAADYNWLFGVRTAGRVPGMESWRDWVYIESGYTWAVWTGGLPLLAAVLALLFIAARTGHRLARSPRAVAGGAGTTLVAVAWMLAVTLLFDPHLTLRGGAELLFVLMALCATLDGRGAGAVSLRRRSVIQNGELVDRLSPVNDEMTTSTGATHGYPGIMGGESRLGRR